MTNSITFESLKNLKRLGKPFKGKAGLFVVEGPHLVAEAGALVEFVVYSKPTPLVMELQSQGLSCRQITAKQMRDISEVETPQGILAVVRSQKFDLNDLWRLANPLIVFCIGIQDPGNLGTIIRTADAVGAAGVMLSKGTVDLYNQKVLRSTMGSIFHLPVMQNLEARQAIKALKEKGVRIISANPASKKSHYQIQYNQSCAILVGNEGAGLPGEILKLSDEVVSIPMPGKAESLNVGVSTAIILYEALRQRMA